MTEKICSYCGKEPEHDGKYCVHCGAHLTEKTDVPQTKIIFPYNGYIVFKYRDLPRRSTDFYFYLGETLCGVINIPDIQMEIMMETTKLSYGYDIMPMVWEFFKLEVGEACIVEQKGKRYKFEIKRIEDYSDD